MRIRNKSVIAKYRDACEPKIANHQLLVYTDGGGIGSNPGTIACGVVVKHHGKVVYAAGKLLGTGTNNTAEFSGTICGLLYCLRKLAAGNTEYANIAIVSDSALMINAFNRSWRMPKSPHLAVLKAKADLLIPRFESVKFIWVPREMNAEADEQCNIVLGK